MNKNFILFGLIILSSCAVPKPKGPFNPAKTGQAPRYQDSYYWAALPTRKDAADTVPPGVSDGLLPQDVDVFYLHPTSFFKKKYGNGWNADLTNNELNAATDKSGVLYQASIFNQAAKVYAPRYRQAHYYAFFTKDKKSADQALALAYEDVYNAFLYYWDNFNNNRPIIIVGHSQGSELAVRLLKEVFDNPQMKNKLVAAYIPGWPVYKDQFKILKECKTPNETSCICSWRTYKNGTKPKWLDKEREVFITNPLSWTNDQLKVPEDANKGMVINMGNEPTKPGVSAQIHRNILWASKPKFRGAILYQTKNYHKGDFNLYYINVRENVRDRVKAYWK